MSQRTLTNDQYLALAQLEKWYRKYQHQFIEISGIVGTGTLDIIQYFIESQEFDPREIMYLSYDQKQVLELASKRYHSYYINGIIYKYTRLVDFDTLPAVNPHASGVISYEWKKEVRKKIDPKYKLIVVFDSLLLDYETLRDLGSFGLPVILVRDPMLLPAPDTYTFMREPNIELREAHPVFGRNPITYFARKALSGEDFKPGSYDNVSIVTRKQMNLYNMRSSDMNIALSDEMRNAMNQTYRSKVLNLKEPNTMLNERLIVTSTMYGEKIVNPDEKRIKIYLAKGMTGNISRINKHAVSTRYVSMDFRPDFYHEPFEELYLDRHKLLGIQSNSRQMVPDEVFEAEYAYALTPTLARYNHWDKGTIILDQIETDDPELKARLLYTAITRFKQRLTIVI